MKYAERPTERRNAPTDFQKNVRRAPERTDPREKRENTAPRRVSPPPERTERAGGTVRSGRNPQNAPARRSVQQGDPRRNNAGIPQRRDDVNNKNKGTKPVGSIPEEKEKMPVGLICSAIAALVILIFIVVFSVRSCSSNEASRQGTGSADDKVLMNGAKAADDTNGEKTPTDGTGLFAEYTENTATLGADGLEFNSETGILIDLDTNTVIAAKNAEEKMFPASMTKVMTLIVAYEHIDDMNATYTFSAELINELYVQNASRAGFSPGETVPLKDLFYGAILPSGADATNALAEYVAGDEKHFADMMNEKAKELGLKNTHFVTASGLHDPDHYSTCHDMAVILRYAISDPGMREILSTYQYTTTSTEEHPGGIALTSTLKTKMDGGEAAGVFVQGGKTGYTTEAKNCLASFAANCTEPESPYVAAQYILVTGGGSGEYAPIYDAINIYGKYCSK